MAGNREERTELLKSLLAGGMILAGLATGSTPFFTLLLSTSVGVGGNILASVAEKAFDNWRSGWFTPSIKLNDDILTTLRESFEQSLRQLEIDWQKQHHYNYLKHIKEFDRARFSLVLIQELREDARKLFEIENSYILFEQQVNSVLPSRSNGATQEDIRVFLENTIEQYFGTVEPLAKFAKVHLPDHWILFFTNALRDERNSRAWRAYQQLWQTSLSASLVETRQATVSIQDDVAQMRQEVIAITNWLNEWGTQLANQPESKRDQTGIQALTETRQLIREELERSLADFQSATELIIKLFRDRFAELEFETVMTNFLQKEMLIDQNVNLEQAGHQTDEDISLSQVFVDLPVADSAKVEPPAEEWTDGKLPPGIIAEIIKAAEKPLDPKSIEISSDGIQLGEQIGSLKGNPMRQGRYVLIGGPGQGKTTVSQLACQLFRAAILKGKELKEPYQVSHGVRNIIRELEALCNEEGIGLPVVPRFPIRIVLNDLAEKLAEKAGVSSLLTYIVDRIREKTDEEVTSSILRKWLGAYPWILILDGLDEVPASSNRDEVLAAIENFLIDAHGVNADVLVVATTRPQGYNKDFAPESYQHKYLTPLSTVRAEHYGKRLVNVRYRQDEERRSKVYERLQRAVNEETTARLMQSPLQITIMTALLGKIGTPPRERWSLFSQYYDVIYQRETERNIPPSIILRDYQPDINSIHYHVGLLLQIESEYPERTGAKLSRDRFSQIVRLRLEQEGHKGLALEQLSKKIIEAAANRLVFLVGVEANEIGFEIRSLQEFMAAEALMEGNDVQVRARLQRIAPIAHWRNVFLFAAGKCFARQQHLRDAIYSICGTLNEVDDSGSKAVAVTKAGSQLAIDLLADGPSRRQPKYATLLTRKALSLLKHLPNQHLLRLADVYEPDLESVYKDELLSVIRATPPYQFGAWTLLSMLEQRGLDWAKQLAEKFWPEEVYKRTDLLLSIIGEVNDLWFLLRLNYDLLELPITEFYEYIGFRRLIDGFNISELEWLDHLNYTRSRRPGLQFSVELNLPGQNESIMGFEVRRVEDDSMVSFSDIENHHPDWLPLKVAATFAASPSKETLAHAMRGLNRYQVQKDRYYWLLPSLLPWPLASLLRYPQSPEGYMRIAEEIERGDFGDLDQWIMTERRWRDNGVSLEDLNYTLSIQRPFDHNVDKIGFPFGSFSYYHTGYHYHTGLDNTRLLLQTYKVFANLKSKSTVPYFTLELESIMGSLLLSLLRESTNILDLMTVEELTEMLSASSEPVWVRAHLLSSIWELEGIEGVLKFTDAISNSQILIFGSDVPEQMVESLADAFAKTPSQIGTLYVLARLAVHGAKPIISHKLLSLERYNDPRFRWAALILQFIQQDWMKFPADQLALNFVKESGDYRSIGEVLTTINAHKMADVEVQSFLVLLHDYLLDNGKWKEACSVWEAIDDLLRQRHSNLLPVWTELGLPKGLDTLVSVTSD